MRGDIDQEPQGGQPEPRLLAEPELLLVVGGGVLQSITDPQEHQHHDIC